MITHIAFDADDTLWKTEDHFLLTGQKFVEILADYDLPDDIMTKFYEIEDKNLNYFGYGIKGFVLSMIETALFLTDHKVSGSVIKQIIDWGKAMQNQPIRLISGVRETLQVLRDKKFFMLIITKGDLFEQEVKIARSGIANMFDNIEIISEKDEQQYQSILSEHKVDAKNFLMIGNSLRSDIKPVINLGAKAIHIPYDTLWVQEQISETERKKLEYYQLDSIKELVGFIDHLNNVLSTKHKLSI